MPPNTCNSSDWPLPATPAMPKISPARTDSETDFSRATPVKTEVQASQEEKEREAEQHFLKAKDFFKQSDFYNCIQFCKLAVKENPK